VLVHAAWRQLTYFPPSCPRASSSLLKPHTRYTTLFSSLRTSFTLFINCPVWLASGNLRSFLLLPFHSLPLFLDVDAAVAEEAKAMEVVLLEEAPQEEGVPRVVDLPALVV